MGKVHVVKITTANFEALQYKDADTLYFVNDSGSFDPYSMETNGRVYLGNKLLSSFAALSLASGNKVYYNGQDVTNNPDAYKFAKSHWYGSWEAYKELRDANPSLIEQDVAYHIMVQPDWNENDPKSLAYIKNKPNIMDMEVEDTTANFFYL